MQIKPIFSMRNNHRPVNTPIKARNDAPAELREAIPSLAYRLGMSPHDLRNELCKVLLKSPCEENWGAQYIQHENKHLMKDANWYQVYDIAEALYNRISSQKNQASDQLATEFQSELNSFFLAKGIGWAMRDGMIERRGGEVFDYTIHKVPPLLEAEGYPRAAGEMREAIKDISRRPAPDITGAIQHSIAALETVAREVTGERNATLGKLIPKLELLPPLDIAIEKLWGFASDRARHIREGKDQKVDCSEAELIVTIMGALCQFIYSRHDNFSGNQDEDLLEEAVPF